MQNMVRRDPPGSELLAIVNYESKALSIVIALPIVPAT